MKLVTYLRNRSIPLEAYILSDINRPFDLVSLTGSISCGILSGGGLIDIPSVWQGPNPPRSIIEILQRGPDCLAQLSQLSESTDISTPLEQVKILAPIPRPGKILALAGNYTEHIKEAGLALGLSASPRRSTVPRPFLKPATVVIGPNEEIPWPAYSEQIDYEIELAVVIGKKAKYVSPDDALECITGYTIVNDVSARSVTFAKNRDKRPWDEFYDWLNGKWADGFLPMGPYLLTRDPRFCGDRLAPAEAGVEKAQNLDMMLKVNGEVRQKANTSQMIYPVADIVSFLSYIMTLEPGDVIATGTPSGVAMATGRFLQPGDTIECTIENLGTLTNTLGPKPKKFYEPLK